MLDSFCTRFARQSRWGPGAGESRAREVAARAEYGEERYEKVDFQNKVHAAYKQLADDAWLMVDALQPTDDIAAQIRARVDLVLEKAKYADFEHLA